MTDMERISIKSKIEALHYAISVLDDESVLTRNDVIIVIYQHLIELSQKLDKDEDRSET